MRAADSLFEGALVLEVASHANEYGRKMPGSYNVNGDHCND
ncbi:hypothetical protein [Carbonactinospora thermoautotrophica]|nr:hypothetical protein [Carbonactinospora thermoautotrophica]